ncbi:DUF1311 domain-containing protein [Aliarcobacter thereius]|uniref:lysozyme inhibitor LprI family protein n=1 Tax=Aliarcobacter thereius TaxID=544718 RepID=UPI0010FE518F|nr:lysozyme inhibitor LprI family protein [Aliarcobacter thereius]TLT06615.1 DUF1311 domain-containing protein [Aliarcobacter thereius]
MMKKYIWLLLKILSVLLVLRLFIYDLLVVYYYYLAPSFSMQGSKELVTVLLSVLGFSIEYFFNPPIHFEFLLIVVNVGLLLSLVFAVIIFKEKFKLLVIASLLLLAVLLFVFPVASVQAASNSPQDLDCDNAYTTLDINRCMAQEVKAAKEVMDTYLQAVLKHKANKFEFDEDTSRSKRLLDEIQASQKQWEAYAKALCDAVYTDWEGGSIRTVMSLSCQKQQIQQRTHDLWNYFLISMESGEPLLPEPK